MLEVGCTTRCSTALQQHGSTAVPLYYSRGYAIYPPPGGTALQRLGLELGSEGLDRLEHLGRVRARARVRARVRVRV